MKKSFITFVFCLFTISFTLNCKASATDSLNQLLINLHSLTAHFTQTIIDGKGNILQQTSGQMALQRPGKFRWETQAPTRQLLVADGNHVW
jgi:outer membrane lipoprotein carrier protein